MFYDCAPFKKSVSTGARLESALVTLNPAESKRLIAKAIAILPEIKAVLKQGTLVITWGTANAYVIEEIMQQTIPDKTTFASGVISEGELNAIHPDKKIPPVVLQNGKPSEIHQTAALSDFKPGDVFIKGANAIDSRGDIGMLVANQTGGSVCDAWFATSGRGGSFICPVGLEKLVPSVNEASRKCNMFGFKYSTGIPASLITFFGKAVTEIQAINLLSGADAYHVASGGIAGSEGAVTLVIEGENDTLERAFELVKGVKGEPPLPRPEQYLAPRAASLNYDSHSLAESLRKVAK